MIFVIQKVLWPLWSKGAFGANAQQIVDDILDICNCKECSWSLGCEFYS